MIYRSYMTAHIQQLICKWRSLRGSPCSTSIQHRLMILKSPQEIWMLIMKYFVCICIPMLLNWYSIVLLQSYSDMIAYIQLRQGCDLYKKFDHILMGFLLTYTEIDVHPLVRIPRISFPLWWLNRQQYNTNTIYLCICAQAFPVFRWHRCLVINLVHLSIFFKVAGARGS